MVTLEQLNARGVGHLPEFLGIIITQVGSSLIGAELRIRPELMAPNGYLHAATVVALADTACGYGCHASLPADALGFTTVELKSNHLGTAREGVISVLAQAVHGGRSTQVWDAIVSHRESAKTIALFRCTQMILYRSP
ncbi:MAG: PaaI family thioesterase [Pseudomonadota bacterium]|nr:PaaI family thioesterase [Pseudomonadota bacterium]